MISLIRLKYFLSREILIGRYISGAGSTLESDKVSCMIFIVRDTKIKNRYLFHKNLKFIVFID